MKNLIANIVLSILLVISGIGLYKLYADKKALEETLNTQIKLTQNLEQEYNQAKIALTNKDIQIKVLDKKLKEALKRKVITKKIYVKIDDDTSGKGQALTDTTQPTIYRFADYRLEATLNTETQDFTYRLHQLFDLNIYQAGAYDYRIEIVEKNRLTGEVVRFIKAKEFSVVQKVESSEQFTVGFNLNIGFAGYVGPALKVLPEPYMLFNFMSYGRTHLDSTWRFASLGVGYQNAIFVPVSYNIGQAIKVLSDAWVDPFIGVSWNKKLIGGIGISSTF